MRVPILGPAHVWGDNKGIVNSASIPETRITKNILVFVTMHPVRPQHKEFEGLAYVRELTTLWIALPRCYHALLRKIRCKYGCTGSRFLCHVIEPV